MDGLEAAVVDLEAEIAKANGDGKAAQEPTLEERLDKAQADLAGQGELIKGDKGHESAAADAGAGSAAGDAKENASGELVLGGKKKKVSTSGAADQGDHGGRVRGGGDGADKSAGAESKGELYEALGKSEEWQDAAPALEHLASVIGKSFEHLADSIVEAILQKSETFVREEIQRQLAPIAKAMGVQLAAEKLLIKSLGGFQAKATDAGVVGKVGDRLVREDKSLAKAGDGKVNHGLSRAEVQLRIEKGVQAEKIDPDFLVHWHRFGDAYLDRLEPDVAKAFEIPQNGALAKA